MDKINLCLTRRVDKIYPSAEALEKIMRSGKKLKLYQGFDPTGTKLHIGHMVGLMKLRDFQDLGHEVIFLIGDGTGQAGDPSGKTKGREKFLTGEELRANAKDYVMQASKIVRFDGPNPVKILYNGDWLNKLTLIDILNLAQNFTLSQLSERDLFTQRQKKGEEVNLREFLYPLLQGYDSVAMDVDLEVGGTDQTFNMLCGRTLVKNILKKEKYVLTTPLLTDSKGQKIGKTEGNVIALNSPADQLFGQIMSLPDNAILNCFNLITNIPLEEIEDIKKSLKFGENPMIFKKKLSWEITRMLNSKDKADWAQDQFEKTVQSGQVPEKTTEFSINKLPEKEIALIDLLVITGLSKSKSDAKRVVIQGGVEVDGKRVTDQNLKIKPISDMIVRSGKRNYRKFI